MEELQEGDVVCLKSDPNVKMTIIGISENKKTACCFWFNNFELRWADFNVSALKKTGPIKTI